MTRQTWLSALPRPSREDWDRLIGERTIRGFALAHGMHENRVASWRSGAVPIHWAVWELLLMREGQHPDYRVTRRRK